MLIEYLKAVGGLAQAAYVYVYALGQSIAEDMMWHKQWTKRGIIFAKDTA